MSSVLYNVHMPDSSHSLAHDRRHLLPRWPSDRVVVTLLVVGAATAVATGTDPVLGMAPGAVAAVVQKVGGHVRAWRHDGVERAFVMESAAISFYVLIGVLIVAAVAQAAGAGVDLGLLVIAALFIDTTVRSTREGRFA